MSPPHRPERTRPRRARLDPRVYEGVFQLASEPGAILDDGGNVLDSNRALCDLLGRESAALKGSRFAALAAPADEQRCGTFLGSVRAWSEGTAELAFTGREGSLVPVQASGRLFVSRHGEALIHVSLRDLRDGLRRERARAAILHVSRAAAQASTLQPVAEALLEALSEALPELTASAYFARPPGRGELVAVADRGLGPRWREERGVQRFGGNTLLAHACRTGEGVIILDAALESLLHDTTLPFEPTSVIAAPVLAGGNVAGGILAASRGGGRLDLRAMELVAFLASEVAGAVVRQEASRRLEEALERERTTAALVRQLNEELEEFALWTTHDIREPLRSLATLAEILEKDADSLAAEEMRGIAGRITRVASLLKERVRGLHDFSASTLGGGAIEVEDLGRVAQRVVTRLAPLATRRRARIEIGPALPVVRAQAGRLDTLLGHLVENAIEHGDPVAPLVRITATGGNGQVEILVEDNGPGIPEELRERVFLPFYKSPASAPSPRPGPDRPGTGLAVVRRIVAQHGGSVRVEAAQGGGARFVVLLPQPPLGATSPVATRGA